MAVKDDGGATITLDFARGKLHDHGRLTGEGSDVQLPPKEWQVLRLLLVSGGALMTKDRLLELGWPQGEVAEESLTRCIYSLRKYLGADKGFIKTIYGRGYRFICPVSTVSGCAEQVCSACGHVSQGVLKRG